MNKIFRIILLLFTLTCLVFFWNKNNLKQDIYKSKKESFPAPTEIDGGITLDLSKLSSGNYFIKIETEEKLGTEKIILQK